MVAAPPPPLSQPCMQPVRLALQPAQAALLSMPAKPKRLLCAAAQPHFVFQVDPNPVILCPNSTLLRSIVLRHSVQLPAPC